MARQMNTAPGNSPRCPTDDMPGVRPDGPGLDRGDLPRFWDNDGPRIGPRFGDGEPRVPFRDWLADHPRGGSGLDAGDWLFG